MVIDETPFHGSLAISAPATPAGGAGGESAHQEAGEFVRAIGLFPATAINMAQMVGIGPFITIPLLLSAMNGPQAMLGWVVGAVLAIADGLIWSELGAALPSTGGSYIFLREAYSAWTGRLVPFLFIWSTLLAMPLMLSTCMIGMAHYLTYFWPALTPLQVQLVAVGFTVLTVALLYRRIDSVARISTVLWAGMVVTVALILGTAATHFHPALAFSFPHDAVAPTPTFISGLGAGLVLVMFNYMGYGTAACLGDEVQRPGYVLPRAIILSIVGVVLIDLALQVGIVGVVPWREAAHATALGSLFMARAWGAPAAAVLTLLILWTAFASGYTGLLGASRLPYNAARDGLFLRGFGQLHPRLGFPHLSLLVLGALTALACFFSLPAILNALTAVFILVQFIGQIGALTILRLRRPDLERPFKAWLYPLPSLVALAGWLYILWASGWPAIRLALLWLLVGSALYGVWTRRQVGRAPSTAACGT